MNRRRFLTLLTATVASPLVLPQFESLVVPTRTWFVGGMAAFPTHPLTSVTVSADLFIPEIWSPEFMRVLEADSVFCEWRDGHLANVLVEEGDTIRFPSFGKLEYRA